MSPEAGRTASLTLEPGGVSTLRWTKAFRGLLTLRATDLQSHHPHHVHDYYTVAVVDHGEAEIQVRDESYRATPGSVILLSPFEVHQEDCASSAGWSYRAMHPAPATMRRVLGLDVTAVLDKLRFIKPVLNDALLADHLDRMFRTSERSADGSIDDRTAERVRESLRRQLRVASDRGPTRRGQRAAEMARVRINDSRRKMTSMAELSALTGLSRFHLSRTFRDITGLPPYAYFEQVRLARAKVLLRRGYGLSAVAMALGYSDQSHFHRQVRTAASTTPGRYAKALRTVFCPNR